MHRARAFLGHPLVAIAGVTLLAAALRFPNLGEPDRRMFDEVYYAKAGCLAAGFTRERCDVTSDAENQWADRYHDVGSWVHPPLGKLAIGLGQRVAGPDAFGWRLAPAVAGTLTVGLVALLAFLLWRRTVWAWVAGALMATEHLGFVHSRIALLDGLLAFWVVLGFVFLVLDRRWTERREPAAQQHDGAPLPIAGGSADLGGPAPAGPQEEEEVQEEEGREDLQPRRRSWIPRHAPSVTGVAAPIWRPWRFATGLALGAAVATKWSGALALLAALVVSLAWERTRRFRAWVERPVRRAVIEEGFGLVLALVLVPLAVYWASYIPYFLRFGWSPASWLRLQSDMLGFSRGLDPANAQGEPIHPYLSAAWQWILMARPVSYFYEDDGGLRREILGMGNPVIFWCSVVALPAMAWRRGRDWVAGSLLVVVLVQYLPWFAISRPKFFFYMAPIAPFLVLSVVWLVRALAGWRVEQQSEDGSARAVRPLLPVAVLIVAASIAAFAWFWPVLTAHPLTQEQWQSRIWFDGTGWSRFNWV